MFRYSPFTAADEKIPLSMVHVNRKPQYLVFCLRSLHLPAKHGQLPVESSRIPRRTRASTPQTRPLFDASQAFPVSSAPLSTRAQPSPFPKTSLAPLIPRRKTQEQCTFLLSLCELWTFGPILRNWKGAGWLTARIEPLSASSADAKLLPRESRLARFGRRQHVS